MPKHDFEADIRSPQPTPELSRSRFFTHPGTPLSESLTGNIFDTHPGDFSALRLNGIGRARLVNATFEAALHSRMRRAYAN